MKAFHLLLPNTFSYQVEQIVPSVRKNLPKQFCCLLICPLYVADVFLRMVSVGWQSLFYLYKHTHACTQTNQIVSPVFNWFCLTTNLYHKLLWHYRYFFSYFQDYTYLKLVCRRMGCPPNAGTAPSIRGWDLMKFSVWSDIRRESLAHCWNQSQHS